MWSVCDIKFRTLLCYILSLSTLCGGYIITTPRRWTVGEETQVCVTLSAPAATEEKFTFEMKEFIPDYLFDFNYYESEEPEILIPPIIIIIPQGTKSICQKITMPATEESRGEITISGSLEGQNFNFTKSVAITAEIVQTFVQTDKFLYKPSQVVQFRILTLYGALLQVSLEAHDEIWIENPSGVRLAQWLDVANENGLIHLSFQLSDEPEEGEYKINVRTSGRFYKRAFKVEEYVLPRFEVTINPPNYILGTTEIITFEVCAKYTFGQPVKGIVDLSVANDRYGSPDNVVMRVGEISECVSFNMSADELSINSDDDYINYNDYPWIFPPYHGSFVSSLKANAIVAEEGTGIHIEANEVSVKISRTALRFKDISVQKYYKPELPYVVEMEVTFPDGSSASNEPMMICCEELCVNRTTNTEGNLKFAIPPHLECDIHITAPNYPYINSNILGNPIMHKSEFFKYMKKYYSPSNSSLKIFLPKDELECTSSEDTINFNLSVVYVVNQQNSASISVQVISRGQIQFSDTFNQEFTSGSISFIDESLFIKPVQETSNPDLIKGYFTVPISLPKTVSPEAQILIWYARDDGEVVSDSIDVSIMECLLNSVNVAWSIDKALPGTNTSVLVSAEPLSLCSLGVVDKSVELLTPKKYLLTIQRVLKLAERASVKPYDFQQVDDVQYCQNQQTDETFTYTTTPLSTSLPSSPITTSSSVPDRRKKRHVLASKIRDENSGRSKRSLIGDLGGELLGNNYYGLDVVDALYMFDDAGVYCFSDLILETRPCDSLEFNYINENYEDDYDFFKFYYYGEDNYPDGGNFLGGLLEGGLLGGLPGDGSGMEDDDDENEAETDDIRTYFPETWIWNLFNISSDGSYEEAQTLPDTVTEWVGSAICVHPSKGIGISNTASIITFKEFFVDLTLPPSVKRGEVFPVKISIFNYLNESLPIRLILESPDDKFDILKDSGDMIGSGTRNTCVPSQDKVVLSIRIRAKEAGDVNISVEATVKANAVSDCGSGIVQQQSDSVIIPIRVNFEGFVKEETQFEYICTNQSVLKTWSIAAPGSIVNGSARGYAAVVGDLLGPTLENLGNLILMPFGCGEQNMLNFAPNIFIVQYLEASNQDADEIINKATEYMRKGYQQELRYRLKDGSFSAFGESDGSGSTWLTAFVLKCFGQASEYILIDQNDLNITMEWLKSKQLESGCFESVGNVIHKDMQGGFESGSPSLLTFYVLIALIEAGESIDSTAVTGALSCINATEPTTNPYSLSLKAYALALANSSDTQITLDQLLSLATSSTSGLYWEYGSSNGVAVEIASYVVLTILAFTKSSPNNVGNYMPYVLPIIRWINTQRNGQGGFISTQDTIIALQALAEYQKTISGNSGDLTVSLTMGTVNQTFSINDQNQLLQQSVAFPTVPISITFDIDGEGCVLIQAVLRYNVPDAEGNEAFSLNVITTTEPDMGCKTKRIEVCAAYLLPDNKSNMAIIEVKLVSGYFPETKDLDELVGDKTGLFKLYEIDEKENKVEIYVHEFTVEEICASFRILREIDVQDLKPGTVKVYDYYKPEYEVTETYTLPPPTECIDKSEVTTVEGETTTGSTVENPSEQ